MKSLLRQISVGLASLMAAYSPASMAMTEKNYEYLYFGIGFVFGSLVALLICVYLKRHYYKKYQRKVLLLKSAQNKEKIVEQAMNTLAKKQQENQDLLEERVQERTLELNIALQELASANQELERKNVIDELTGLHNRRFYDQKIVAEYRRSRRNLTPLSLVLIDIDHFKSVNDSHGHLAGDHCLVWVAKQIEQSLKRSADKAFRYGGEEFCLILPDTDAQGAFQIAEQLRLLISQQACQLDVADIRLTISCGTCTYQQEADVSPEQIFAGADKALYEAKHNGRNRTQQYTFIKK